MKTLRFKYLVHQYKHLVYNQAYYFTGNKEDAEDITQETLLKLWRHLETVKGDAVKSWLMKVTRNVCIDHSRKRREQSFSEFEPREQDRIISCPGDAPENPEQIIISKDLLQQGFKQLPEVLRSIVIMREIQGLPYSLIAKTMELPLNTVKVYLHRGRKLLAQHLSQSHEEPIAAE